jgi:hypothetical protein
MPPCASTTYSCGMAWISSRSPGMTTARATSCTRSTSACVISSRPTATTPLDGQACTCSPAMPV